MSKLILGDLIDGTQQIESTILSFEQITELLVLCGFPLNQKWELIYRASKDGFGSNHFHSKCDIKPNTLIVIKSTNGNIFGGYTEQDWAGANRLKNDEKAFIFSLVNKDNKPLVMKRQMQYIVTYLMDHHLEAEMISVLTTIQMLLIPVIQILATVISILNMHMEQMRLDAF